MSHPIEGASAQPDFLTPSDQRQLVGSVQLAGDSLRTMFAAADVGSPDDTMTAYNAFLEGHRSYAEFVRKRWGIDASDSKHQYGDYCDEVYDTFWTHVASRNLRGTGEIAQFWRNNCATTLFSQLGYDWSARPDMSGVRHPIVADMLTGTSLWQALGAQKGQELLRVLPGYRALKHGTSSTYPNTVSVDANSALQDTVDPLVRLVHPDTHEPYFIAHGGGHAHLEKTIQDTKMAFHGSVDIPTTQGHIGGRVFDHDGTVYHSGASDQQERDLYASLQEASSTPMVLWTRRNAGDAKYLMSYYGDKGIIFRSGVDFGNWPLSPKLSDRDRSLPLVDDDVVATIRSQFGTLFSDTSDRLYAESALDRVVGHLRRWVGDDRQKALETKPPVIAAMMADMPLSPEERVGMLRRGVVYNDRESAIDSAVAIGVNTVMVNGTRALIRGISLPPRVRTDR